MVRAPRPEEAAVDRRVDRLGARAAPARGRRASTRPCFERTMSIIVKHRTDLDVVAERVGVKLRLRWARWRAAASAGARLEPPPRPARCRAGASTAALPGAARARPASTRACSSSPTSCAARASRVGTSELLDAFDALGEVGWTGPGGLPRGARGHARQVAGGPAGVRARVRPLLLPRRRARGGRAGPDRASASTGAERPRPRGRSARSIRDAIRGGSDGEMRDLARLAIAAFGRQGEGSGVIGVDVQRIRRTLGLRGERRERGGRPARRPRRRPARAPAAVRAPPAPRARARPDRAHAVAPAGQAAPRLRPRAAERRRSQDLAAVHRVVAQLKRRLATQGARAARPAALARSVDVRRTLRASLETGGVPAAPDAPRRGARADPSSTCSATCRPA